MGRKKAKQSQPQKQRFAEKLRLLWLRLCLMFTNPSMLSEAEQKELAKTKKSFKKIVLICVGLFLLVLIVYAFAASITVNYDGVPVWGPGAQK